MTKNIVSILIFLGAINSSSAQNILSLKDAQQIALDNNKQIKKGELAIRAAEQTYAGMNKLKYPSVSFVAATTYAAKPLVEIDVPQVNLPVYDGNPANLPNATEFAFFPGMEIEMLQKTAIATVNATQPIYVGGKIRTATQLANQGVVLRKEQQQLTTKELLLTTAQQYWQIVSLQEKSETIAQYEKLLAALKVQVDDAFKAGLIVQNDVYKLTLEQSQLNINKNKLQNGQKLALMQLCTTLGVPFDSTFVLQNELDDYQAPDYYRSLANGENIEELSEVKLLNNLVELQDLQINLKEADYKPQIVAGVQAFHLNQWEKDSGNTNAFGFASIQLPISSWWSKKTDIKELEIQKQIAIETLQESKELLGLRAAKSWTDLNEYYQEIQIMEERVQQATENLKINQSSYQNGVVTLSDLLEAQALHTSTIDELITAKTKYQVGILTYLAYSRR